LFRPFPSLYAEFVLKSDYLANHVLIYLSKFKLINFLSFSTIKDSFSPMLL
jgi:hypothetical protein